MTLAAGLALGGCAIGPDYQEPALPVADRFTAQREPGLEAAEPRSERWWQNFNDPVLDELVSRADMQNINLRRSLLALEVFRAQYTVAFARLFPDMDTGLAYSWRRINANQLGVPTPDSLATGFSNWQWNIASATWEVDVWGAVRRQIEAGVSRVQMAASDYRAALVSVRAEVAQAYLTVRQLQAQRAAFRDLARGYEKLVDAIDKKVRYQAGSKVELAEVRSRRASAMGDAERFDGLIAQQVAGIAILLGETPEHVREMVTKDAPVPRMDLPISLGVPGSLLRRRPDVVSAERELQAATAEIGVAEAGYLPRFGFSGNFVIQSPDFQGLGNVSQNMTYNVSPAVSWRFMDILTGVTEARVVQARARAADALLKYQLTAVTAVNQVEASITAFGAARRVRASYAESATDIQQAFDLAFLQYRTGTIDITRLIQYLQAYVVARDGLAQSEGLAAQSCVELYRSLGGGWEMAPTPPQVDDIRRFNPTPTANDFLAHDPKPSGG